MSSNVIAGLSKYIFAYSPQYLPNMPLWLDASDTSTYTSGSNITTFRNKGYALGTFDRVAGTISTSTLINGLQSLTFTGAFANGARISNPSVTYIDTTRTAVFVFNRATGSSPQAVYFLGTSTSQADVNLQMSGTGTNLAFLRWTSGSTYATLYQTNSPSPSINTGTHIVVATSLSTNQGLFVDGVQQTLNTNTPVAFTTGSSGGGVVGGILAGVLVWNVCEVMVFDGALTDIQRREVEGYVAQKWGVALPSTHPYYTSANFSIQRPFNRSFYPVDILGCQLWIDAADAASVTGTTSVTNVADKSGNNVVLSGATGFAYPNNTFNGGKPSFYNPISALSGTGSGFTLGTNNAFAQTTPFTVFFVAQFTAATNFSGYIMDSGTTSTGRPYTYQQNISTPFGFASTSVLLSPCVISMNWITGTSTSQVYVNGTLNYSGTLGALTTTGITVGNRYSLTESWPGHICELVWFSGTLPTQQRLLMESYLAWKWNLTASLVAGHPGKTLGAYANVFSPKEFTTLGLWLDGGDATSIAVTSGSITTWYDKSGNAYNATVASGKTAPTFTSADLGVQFPATTSGLVTSYPANPTSETMFVVFNNAAPTVNNCLLIGGGSGARSLGAGYSGFTVAATGKCGLYNNQIAWLATTPTSSYTSGTTAMITTQISSLTSYITMNGGTFTSFTTSSAFTGGTTTYLGVDTTSASFYYVGYVNEIIIYNSLLTLSQRQQVEGYLANKWNIQSLMSSSHAYKEIEI
jgi:hypothetical protein